MIQSMRRVRSVPLTVILRTPVRLLMFSMMLVLVSCTYAERVVTDITIVGLDDFDFVMQEEDFDLSGIMIEIVYDDLTTMTVPVTDASIEGDFLSDDPYKLRVDVAGSYTFMLTYEEFSKTFTYVVLEPEHFTISFVTYTNEHIDDMVFSENEPAYVPSPNPRDGHVFAGWYEDDGFTSPYDPEAHHEGDLVLHALWTPFDPLSDYPFFDGNLSTTYEPNAWNLDFFGTDVDVLDLTLDQSVDILNPRTVMFDAPGEQMYVLGRSSQNIVQYTLETTWDITSAIYSTETDLSDELDAYALENTEPHGIDISVDDGQRLFVFNRRQIFEYRLTIPWDISSAIYVQNINMSFFEGGHVVRGHEIHFRQDGRKLYIDDREYPDIIYESGQYGKVHEYILDTPWDISTLRYNVSFELHNEIPGGVSSVRGNHIHPQGTLMWVIDTETRQMIEYQMTVPWDLSSSVYDGRFAFGPDIVNPRSLYWRRDGMVFYVVDTTRLEICGFWASPAN